ncbi:MAG: DUF4214 domain-containing protein [Halieaceae bacterium]|nr:DUF4214 domain-containing protein [Halieaceae bacterium]
MNEEKIIQNAYLAYYGRPADPAGLDYWAGRLKDAGGNLDEIIVAFGTSTEFTERFGALENNELVNAIYQRLFKRDADPAGLEFYLELLESGEKHLGSIALDIFNGVKREGGRQMPPQDWEIIEELQRTANAFTEQVRKGELDYSGERGLEVGTQMVASIPSDNTGMVYMRETGHLAMESGVRSFLDVYVQPDWYASMFTAQLGEDRSLISVDRAGDVGGSLYGSDHRWSKIHTHWPAGEDSITFEGRFLNVWDYAAAPHLTDSDGHYVYNIPAGDYRIELSGDELPDNAKIGWFYGFNPYSNYSNNDGILNLSDGTLEHLVRIETPLTFVIQVDGMNTGAEYELTVTRQEGVNYPVYEPDWIPFDNSERLEFLDFILVEPPPEFFDYMI